MYNIIFALLSFLVISTAEANTPSKGLPKKLCFESYPRTTYSINGTHNWTVNEIIASKTAYKTYQLITISQVKDKSGFYNFTFGGHAKNNNNDNVPVSGVGYEYEGKFKVELQTAFLVPETIRPRGASGQFPAISAIAFWDMYTMTGPEPGSSVYVTDVLNNNLIPQEERVSNIYQVDVVKPISCSEFGRSGPSN